MVGFTTRIVHSDRASPVEHGSIHKPIHATVAYGYDDVQDLADVFQGNSSGYSYGRQVNPTVSALESQITLMEKGRQTICFSTGMAAIGTMLFALMRSGDHLVSSSFLFGNTNSLFGSFDVHGIDVSFVDATDVKAVESALTEHTKMVFVETIANPRTQVSDLEAIGALCRDQGIVYIVDNTMTSPYLFQPIDVGASLVVNSLTKYICGHGNALGGAITDTGQYDWSSYARIEEVYKKGDSSKWGMTQIRNKGLRDFGAALGAEAAHHISIGSETLALRLEKQSASAQTLAEFLDDHEKVANVYYPGLSHHPQFQRSAQLFRKPGALFSFELNQELEPFDFLNRLKVVIKSSNLGDNRTLAIPVSQTIYYEMGPARRKEMGIAESLIRISVGIEEVEDLIEDFRTALES